MPQIIIEERRGEELRRLGGSAPEATAPDAASTWNPAFDVTPATLVTGYVTDSGLLTLDQLERMQSPTAPRSVPLVLPPVPLHLPAMSSILALDQGTTGSTALVIHRGRSVLGRGYREFTQYFPQPGWVEHDAEEIVRSRWRRRGTLLRRRRAAAAGSGITNQRETLVVWDRHTSPAGRAIVWQDRRTSERCRELKAAGHEAMIRGATGLVIDPYFSATKLEWLLRDPALRQRAERGEVAVGHHRQLAGRPAHRRSDSCHRPHQCLAHAVVRPRLPGLAPRACWRSSAYPGSCCRASCPHRASWGRPIRRSSAVALPIAGIAGDQQSALFGQGCIREGLAKNTYGTGAFLLTYTGQSRPTPGPGVLLTAACGPMGEPAYALEGSVFIAGAAVQWLRDGLGLISRAAETEALARECPGHRRACISCRRSWGWVLPYWEPEARGTIVGLTRGTTRAHLVRAALESMAFASADLLAAMLAGSGGSISQLRVDGGATANDWLMQFQADVLDRPVERPDNVETTALGAGALAGLALGVWPSVDAFLSRRQFRRFEPQHDAAWREARWRGWRRAVAATLGWARGGDAQAG